MKAAILDWLDGHIREVMRGAIVSFFVKGLGAIFGFAFNIMLARTLGANDTGIYFLALTITTVSSVIARVGLDNTVLRFVAAHASLDEWNEVNSVVRKSISLVLLTSILTMISVLMAATFLANSIFSKPELAIHIMWMSLSIPFLSLLMIHAEMLRGLKRILFAESLLGLIFPLTLILSLYFFASTWGVAGAEKCYVLATVIAASSGIWIWHFASPDSNAAHTNLTWKVLLETCLPLFTSSVLNQAIMPWLPFFTLGILATQNEVGLFGMATRTALLISAVLVAANSIAAPKIAALYKQNKLQELEQLAQKTTLLLILIATPITVLIVAFPYEIMALFGSQFQEAGNVLRILAIGQLINTSCGPVGYLLIMSGKEWLFQKSLVYSSLILVTLIIWLVPHYQAAGAALASSITITFNNVFNLFLVRRHLGITVLPYFDRGYTK